MEVNGGIYCQIRRSRDAEGYTRSAEIGVREGQTTCDMPCEPCFDFLYGDFFFSFPCNFWTALEIPRVERYFTRGSD